MYRDVNFSIEQIDQVEKDLQEAQRRYPRTKRVFLINGDAFVLSASRLKPIAKLINKYLPEVEVITMYASINNIKGKTDEELRELKDLKIDELWVGAETGHAEALLYHNKGFTLEDSYEQLERLNEAGITFLFGFMFGAAGKGKGIENAEATAKLINATKPIGIVPTTLSSNDGTQLAKDIADGTFELATEIEVFEEQKKLIELIELENVHYLGIHIINSLSFDALLPRDKEKSLKKINEAITKLDEDYLNSVPKRHTI
jgi:radical SAM superfamily enzyme YgiQ (UPF0313 family)